MVWIRKREAYKHLHMCDTPPNHSARLMDMWGCDTCGQVWIMRLSFDYKTLYSWVKARWWRQWWYHPRYTCGCKIGKDNRCSDRGGAMHGILYPEVTAPEDIATLFDPPEKGL